MPVVTRTAAASLLKEAIVLDLGDLTRQGEQIVAAAQAKAAQIVAQAQQEARKQAEEIREEALRDAKAQGLEEGLAEGRKKGHAEALAQSRATLEALQERWSQLAAQWEENRATAEREARQGVLELGLALGEKLVQRIIEVDPTVIVDQLGAALEHVLKPLEVTVLIHPGDRPVLEEAMPGMMAQFPHLKGIHLKDEESVGRGGCKLRFGQGAIDATVETQLRRIVELLLPAEEGESTEGEAIEGLVSGEGVEPAADSAAGEEAHGA